jgi:hypothetical protein
MRAAASALQPLIVKGAGQVSGPNRPQRRNLLQNDLALLLELPLG